MDTIYSYLMENKMVMLVLLALAAWGFWRLTARPMADLPNKGLVQAHTRFNRREEEAGDRRRSLVLPLPQGERRTGLRRQAG